MDTKSRKSSKLAKLIIALCVMIPALLIVSLYPRMEEAMLAKKTEYENLGVLEQQNHAEWVILHPVVNYAMEASYCLYNEMLQEATGEKLDSGVFQEYGWSDDFQSLRGESTYTATYRPDEETEPIVKKNADLLDTSVAHLVLRFDSYGNLERVILNGDVELFHDQDVNLYRVAERSREFFENNVTVYNSQYETELDSEMYIPKNFEIEVGFNENSSFVERFDHVYSQGSYYDTEAEYLYGVIGAYWIVVLCILFVVIIALTLPFITSLNTGKEKMFSVHFETMMIIALCTIALGAVLCIGMARTTMWEITNSLEQNGYPMFLGTTLESEYVYNILRVVEFFGWSLFFFLIYIITANLRQLISDTKYYLKYQTFVVRILRWMKKKILVVYHYLMVIDLRNKLEKSILKIVVANGVLLTILTFLWFLGIGGLMLYWIGLILYSIALMVILRKQCKKIQNQYHSILYATEQMAEGDLKIKLEEELGVFEPIGKSLEKVQQGFEKAVVEEAKSQNMKTELITNVSHDLKTPLTAIITYVDLLKKENISEEERKSYIQTLDQKSQRLKVLIEDLFEVSKAHSGNVKMNFMDVDVVSLLKQVRSEMDEQILESDLQFRWKLPEEKVILSLDGQRTYRVFENLLSNILKYAMPNSRVYVDIKNTESQVEILFRNVSAMELSVDTEQLTERFVRGDVSRNSEGSGLGLAIAKSFVELQHGTFKIEVDGDLFKVYISFNK